MSIEALLEENTKALNRNSDLLDRVVAGQGAAMEKMDTMKGGRKSSTASAKSSSSKATETKKDEGKAAETKKDDGKKSTDTGGEVSVQDAIDAATGFMQGADNPDLKKDRGAFLGAIVQHFGSSKFPGEMDGEQRKQAVFYVKRHEALGECDLNADFDFDGDPAQGGSDDKDSEDGPEFG